MRTAERSTGEAASLPHPLGPRRVLPLSADAISQIHASKHITSLTDAILPLLQNSLDADATRIEISVDWRRGGCTIDDNGFGIPSAELSPDGGIGKMYCTSKQFSLNSKQASLVHGSTGTFLAELAAMSLLSITSKSRADERATSLTLHRGKAIARHATAGGVSEFSALHPRHGTNITVRDLFGSMPVRVKQRALAAGAGADEGKEWQELKCGIVGLLLAWPYPCAVKLSDANSQMKTITLAASHPAATGALTERTLNALAGQRIKFDVRDVLPVLLQSGFAPSETRGAWIPLSATTSVVSLKGMICMDPAPTKNCQFIAVGVTPCGPAGEHNELYSVVNKLFSNSSFGTHKAAGSEDILGAPRDKGSTTKQLKPLKGIDRHAMYFINLELAREAPIPSAQREHVSGSALKSLTEVLEAAVTAWLQKHHFRSVEIRRRKDMQHLVHSGSSLQEPEISPSSCGSIATPNTSRLPITSDSNARFSENGHKHHEIIARSNVDHHEPEVLYERDPGYTGGMKFGRPRQARKDVFKAQSSAQHSEDPEDGGHQPNAPDQQMRLRAPIIEAEQYSRTFGKEKLGQGTDRSDDYGDVDDRDLVAAAEGVMVDDRTNAVGRDDGITVWTDPKTKHSFRVNSRTGVVLPFTSAQQNHSLDRGAHKSSRHRVAIDTTLSSTGKPISLARRYALKSDRPSSTSNGGSMWLPGFLKQWNNPVFAQRQEDQIPVASVLGPCFLDSDEAKNSFAHGQKFKDACSTNHTYDVTTKLSKTALYRAQAIAQVDGKFILVKFPPAAKDEKSGLNSTLVLIDQHAASERVILETLLDELCYTVQPDNESHAVTIRINSTPLINTSRSRDQRFEVSSQEYELFTRHRSYFAAWGIHYDLENSPQTLASSNAVIHRDQKKICANNTLSVTAVPTVIAERCSNMPALTIDLLRSEIWAIADGSKKANPPKVVRTADDTGQSESSVATAAWVNLLPNMPIHLLQMLHSRACRSAIMFNDILAVVDCQELVDQLGKCIFPFVCAHGRVAMVPVMDIGEEGRIDFSPRVAGGGASKLANACSSSTGGCEYRDRENGIDLKMLKHFTDSRVKDAW